MAARTGPRGDELLRERMRRMPELLQSIHPTGPGHLGYADRGIMALVNPERLRRILSRMFDENEFLSPYGIRAISRFHAGSSLCLQRVRTGISGRLSACGVRHGYVRRQFKLARSDLDAGECADYSRTFEFYLYYGDNFKIECPTGSGNLMNLFEVAQEIREPADPDILTRGGRQPAGIRRNEKFQNRSSLEGLHSFLRIFPRRQWRRLGGKPPDRLDRIGREAD